MGVPTIYEMVVMSLLVVLVVLALSIRALLVRIAAAAGSGVSVVGRNESSAEEEGEKSDEIDVRPGSAFAKFLEEDPARQQLPKREQFKSFREWRRRQGMSWSARDGEG